MKYRARTTGASSDRYGCCEVCHDRASDVWHQVRYRFFSFQDAGQRYEGWTYVTGTFGHESCLRRRQRLSPDGPSPITDQDPLGMTSEFAQQWLGQSSEQLLDAHLALKDGNREAFQDSLDSAIAKLQLIQQAGQRGTLQKG